MSELTFDAVRTAILEAGFEVFRAKENTIQLAERVRSHLMDAGIRVQVTALPSVAVTVRAQRSDFPSATPDELFAKVRSAMAELARAQGFVEAEAQTREIQDPVDANRVLDVWYELTYQKPITDRNTLVSDIQFALGLPKCIAH